MCQWQSVAVVSRQATGHLRSSPKRNFPSTVTPGEKSLVSESKVEALACSEVCSSQSVTIAER